MYLGHLGRWKEERTHTRREHNGDGSRELGAESSGVGNLDRIDSQHFQDLVAKGRKAKNNTSATCGCDFNGTDVEG